MYGIDLGLIPVVKFGGISNVQVGIMLPESYRFECLYGRRSRPTESAVVFRFRGFSSSNLSLKLDKYTPPFLSDFNVFLGRRWGGGEPPEICIKQTMTFFRKNFQN